MVWKACLACLLKACLACLEGLSSWLEGWCWLGGRLAVESHTHDALGRSADIKGHIKNRYQDSHLLESIISNFLLEYVFFVIFCYFLPC